MNTALEGNHPIRQLTLDIAGSYPTGLMAQLGPYNNSQELINAQIAYTANQADISSQQGAAYALENSRILQLSYSQETEYASININSANEINYINQNSANYANLQYTDAYNIEKSSADAGYSAYLTIEASQVRLDRLNTSTIVSQLANSTVYINPNQLSTISTISGLVVNFKAAAQNQVNDASGNVQSYITNTQNLLNNTIVKSSSLTSNLTLVAAFNTFTKAVAQMISFPLLEISAKDTLVTQNVPSIVLTYAIDVSNIALVFLNALISKLSNNAVDVSSFSTSLGNYANTLDSIARSNDINKYFRDKLQNNLIISISTMIRSGTTIAIPSNNPYTIYGIANTGVEARAAAAAANALAVGALNVAASATYSGAADAAKAAVVAAAAAAAAISPLEATKLAKNAVISAQNARSVSNAMANLITAFNNTSTIKPYISSIALNSSSSISSMINTIATVRLNASAYAATAIIRRASNTILGELKLFTENESVSLEAAADAASVLALLNTAYNISVNITDLTTIQNKHWSINTATARAREISEKLKDRAFLLSRTAHNLVTPEKIAVLTANANTLGALNANNISKIDRTSRNVYQSPPNAYTGFKANIRAETFIPVRSSLDELVYKNRIQPLKLDSLQAILDTKITIDKEVQQIRNNSSYSFRQQ